MSNKNISSKVILIYDDNPHVKNQSEEVSEYTIKTISPEPANTFRGNLAEKKRAKNFIDKVDVSLSELTGIEAILIDHKMTDLNEIKTPEILKKINDTFSNINRKIHVFFFTGGDGLVDSDFVQLDNDYSSLIFHRTIRASPKPQWVIESLKKTNTDTFLKFDAHFKNFPAPLRVIHKEKGVVYFNSKWQGVIDRPDVRNFFDEKGAKTGLASYAELNPSKPEDEDSFNYPVTEVHSFVDPEINKQLSGNCDANSCNYLVQFVQVVLPEKGIEIADILTKLQERFNNSKFDDGSSIELSYYRLDAFKADGNRKSYTKSLAWKRNEGWQEDSIRTLFPHELIKENTRFNSNGGKLITISNTKDDTELFIPIYFNPKQTDLIATLVLKIKTNENNYIKFKKNKINRIDGSIYNAVLGIRHFLKNVKQNNWNQLHQKFDQLQKISHDKILDLLDQIVSIACKESKAEMVFLSTTSKVLFPQATTKVAYNVCPRAEEILSFLDKGFKLHFDTPESVMPSVIAKNNQKSLLWLRCFHEKDFDKLIKAYENNYGFKSDDIHAKEALIEHLRKCHSILAIPVIVAGDVVAVFAMHSYKPFAFDLRLLNLLNFLVDCSENILNHYYHQSLQKTFVEGVAHEQRNLLEPLMNQISQINDAPTKLQMVADNLARSVHNIMIVYDQNGKEEQYTEKVDINFYDEVIKAIKERKEIDSRKLEQRNAMFRFPEKPKDNLMIKNNLLSIRLILGNILDNTVKYCAQNSTIHIELSPIPDSVILCVKNDINLEQDRFKPDLKSAGDGYGVGLSVCEKLSEWLDMEFTTKEEENLFYCELAVKLSE